MENNIQYCVTYDTLVENYVTPNVGFSPHYVTNPPLMLGFSIISSQDQIRTGMVLFDILGFKAIFYAPPSATSTTAGIPLPIPPPDYFNLHLMLIIF